LSPNDDTHPAFGAALREAAAAGVRVLACDCRVTPDSLTLRSPVPVIL
ncbi:MAG: DNA/RNA nuclease SfsA, partial [Oscillospiraceae bacterium]|nr:DNA/RNA nuclease SfsA [Oscillospiraceae bacterium]